MPDFEVHPVGTGARLTELEAMLQVSVLPKEPTPRTNKHIEVDPPDVQGEPGNEIVNLLLLAAIAFGIGLAAYFR